MNAAAPIHLGRVDDAGHLIMDDPPRWPGFLSRLKGKVVEVVVRAQIAHRSRNQNAWYWGVIVPYVAEYLSGATGLPITNEQAHELLKRTFLGVEMTPMGVVIRSTRVLDVEEFSNYCTQIQVWAATEWELTIPSPGEIDIQEGAF